MVASSSRTSRTPRRSCSLNPLHCGAVVASRGIRLVPRRAARGLNPLHCGAVVASPSERSEATAATVSQSPSLRGSGRFDAAAGVWLWRSYRLNPLHCGAVVASRPRIPPLSVISCLNPLHCGAVVASRSGKRQEAEARVLIPFIAGQWSLQEGAGNGRRRGGSVLIPFIAGQWSLQVALAVISVNYFKSQSPSLRGSGRFKQLREEVSTVLAESQSPSLRGSGRFSMSGRSGRTGASCLNPLHCGAVVASSAPRPRAPVLLKS